MGGLICQQIHQTCQSADLLGGQIHQNCWGVNLPADLLTVRKSASRNGGGKFVSRNGWKSASIFTKSASQQICWGVNLLADFLTVRKPASRNGGLICQQIPQICQSANLHGGICQAEMLGYFCHL